MLYRRLHGHGRLLCRRHYRRLEPDRLRRRNCRAGDGRRNTRDEFRNALRLCLDGVLKISGRRQGCENHHPEDC